MDSKYESTDSKLVPEVYSPEAAAGVCGLKLDLLEQWISEGILATYDSSKIGQRAVRAFDIIAALTKVGREIPPELHKYKQRVLIAEDDNEMAKSISRLLRNAGFVPLIACDGFQAGSMLESFCPFVIILDMNMPNMQGMEVLEYIRGHAEYSHVQVIVVSAAPHEKLMEALKKGAACVIEKPFENEYLIKMVQKSSGS